MWSGRSKLIEIYVSPTLLGLASPGLEAASWIETDGLDDTFARITGALTSVPWQSCGRVRIWLGATLARPLMLSATSGARNREEAKELAAVLAPDATGLDGSVRVWANAWRANRGGMAVVMPDSVWAAAEGVIQQARTERPLKGTKDFARALELVSVRPWWNQTMDAMIQDSTREGNRIGWSLMEGRGVVHGIIDKGAPVDAGFDLLGEHDIDGSLLRRRLQVNWDSTTAYRHLEFARHSHSAEAALGGWRASANDIT